MKEEAKSQALATLEQRSLEVIGNEIEKKLQQRQL